MLLLAHGISCAHVQVLGKFPNRVEAVMASKCEPLCWNIGTLPAGANLG